jgi:hypothetical protein
MKGITVASVLALLTSSVSATVVRRQGEAATTITKAAASTVTSDSTQYLPFESIQLTEANIDPLNETLTRLFSFENITVADISGRSKIECKTFPGDALWPQEWIWDIFDTLLGGALIKTVPIAAPCYPGPYYNAARCTVVVSNWTDADLQ